MTARLLVPRLHEGEAACCRAALRRSPEEALVHAVVEARRAAPAILFLPHLQVRCFQ